MGLDCYVNVKTGISESGVHLSDEIWYGRKEFEIHNWMQRQSGIPAEEFNCEPLPLTTELLDKLEQDSLNDAEETQEVVANLISVTRKAITEGKEPFYFSWW